MDEQLIALYHRHVGTAFDRQQRFAAFQEKKGATGEVTYDPATATLAFAPKVVFADAPLVGSHAASNNSWLWAWANKNLKLTLTNRALGDTVRATWHRVGVHPLGANAFALEPFLGPELTASAAHVLGVVLVGELGYDAYFTLPHDGVTELVLVRDDRLKAAEKKPLVRIVTLFPQLFGAMPVFDHKAAFVGYAQDYGLAVAEEGHAVRVADGGDHLLATFDSLGRLTRLEGTVTPETPKPVKKPKPKPKAAKAKNAVKKAAKVAAKTTKKPAKKRSEKPLAGSRRASPAKPQAAPGTTSKKPAIRKPAKPTKKVAAAKKPAAKKR